LREIWKGSLYVFLGASSYGLLSPLIKLAYEDGISYEMLSGGMLWLAALFFSVLLIGKRQQLKRLSWRREIIPLAWIGILGLGLTTVFINKALVLLDASIGIVLLFQFTWMVFVIDYLVTRSKPTKYEWVSIGLVFIGTILAVRLIGAPLGTLSGWGIVFGLASGLSYSIFLYFTSRIRTAADSWVKSAVMTIAPALTIGLVFVFLALQQPFPDLENFLFWTAIVTLFGPLLPTLLFNLGAPRIGGGLTAIIGAVELPITLLASLWLIQEAIMTSQWLGIFFILAGIMISQRK
jgi:drug/metabolite transporter (DMT)-like permease